MIPLNNNQVVQLSTSNGVVNVVTLDGDTAQPTNVRNETPPPPYKPDGISPPLSRN